MYTELLIPVHNVLLIIFMTKNVEHFPGIYYGRYTLIVPRLQKPLPWYNLLRSTWAQILLGNLMFQFFSPPVATAWWADHDMHRFPCNILYINACQRGGVSNEPPGQRQDTGPGILWSIHRWTRPTKILKRNEPHIWFAFFTKTGWAWHVTI